MKRSNAPVQRYNILFQPDNILVEVDAGVDLLTGARKANIEIQCSCGGGGTCGKCLLRVVSGSIKSKGHSTRDGWSVACQTCVAGDVVVEIPASSRVASSQVLLDDHCDMLTDGPDLQSAFPFDPLCKKVTIQIPPPSIVDPSSDASRMLFALQKATGLKNVQLELEQVRTLAETLRGCNWCIDVTYASVGEAVRIISIDAPSGNSRLWGIAVDIGTTTVVVYLVDLLSGAVTGKAGTHNKQAQFGDDVISRIIYTDEETDGLEVLQQAVVDTINGLIATLVAKYRIEASDIRAVVAAGNTTMAHLFFGIDPRYIRLEPYVPAVSQFPVVKARELGLKVHSEAVVYNFPAVASYVGGDIVAGTLVNGMAEEDAVTLFIDIGTNGEMVLGNKEWLVSCSCSAGPAFEGAGITNGMRATQGAIERVVIDKKTYEVTYSVIGQGRPLGICGSGLIDALAEMREAGVIDRAGKMQELPTPRIRKAEDGIEFVLAWADEADRGLDVVITEADVKNLLRAKGAVYAGVRCLLKTVNMEQSDIEQIYIAGGFGSYLNIADAVEIGMLPDIGTAKYQFFGNASVKGAYAALTAASAIKAAGKLAEHITYVELSAGNVFMEEFISALFLPHTDLSLFPSVGS
ncbi:ASKHA domain-containing protein [Anaerospora sp.]|uniref:ASKHA domain-containing protein n=1 Tax=Anaerospora sp. TaxID=1960278 RepID=UPI0028A19A0C|nr:ASKHA domain-containing protein [Anaerospora sp.]